MEISDELSNNIAKMEQHFKIPEFIMPTPEQLQERAAKWWEIHKGINFLDWNDKLKSMSYPFSIIPLDSSVVKFLIDRDRENNMSESDYIYYLAEKIYPGIKSTGWENSFFIKTLSRSPKDFLYDAPDGYKISSPEDASYALINSMRIFEDWIQLMRINKTDLVVRPFIEIEHWQEWRVMVENGEIKGISQYFYEKKFDFIRISVSTIEKNIREFMDLVIKEMSVDTFVADIVYPKSENDKMILLETNPYGLSDPCLFYSYQNLDGSFKYVK